MKWIYYSFIFSIIFYSAIDIGYGGNLKNDKKLFKSIETVPESILKKLAGKKIYFGHQSVGKNIIDGICDLIKEYPKIGINVVNTNDIRNIKGGVFAHSRVERNREPMEKIRNFSKTVERGIGNHADIAFFKLCMVDFDDKSDIERIFKLYHKNMSKLEKSYLNTKFVHITVPVTTDPPGIKNWLFKIKNFIKKTVRKPIYDFYKRANYNNKMRKEYGNKRLFFDLALIEATKNDGSITTIKKNNTKNIALAKEYTYDGGHLNKKGRKVVAEKLLLYLISII